MYAVVVYIYIQQNGFDMVNNILKLWMSSEIVTFVLEFILIEIFEAGLMNKAEDIRVTKCQVTNDIIDGFTGGSFKKKQEEEEEVKKASKLPLPKLGGGAGLM